MEYHVIDFYQLPGTNFLTFLCRKYPLSTGDLACNLLLRLTLRNVKIMMLTQTEH